jgi:hypothetical protein
MSQFPLEGGLPAVTKLRRTRGTGSATLGINESLNAPGLVPIPVELSRGQRTIDQLGQVLGIAGQTIEAAGQVAAQEAARANRRTAQIEEELSKRQKEIAQADRGQGSLDARSTTPDLERQILAGELKPGAGPDGQPLTDQQFADQFIADRTQGFSQDYAEAFTSHAKPQIMEALARRREAAINVATGQNQDLILAGVATANTADALEQSAAALRSNNPKLSDQQARALVASNAIKNAVDLGSVEALDRAAAFGGDAFAPGVAVARTRLEARVIERENQARRDTVSSLDARLGVGEPIESVYADAVQAQKEGKISGGNLLEYRTKLETEQKARAAEATKALDAATLAGRRDDLLSGTSAIMEAGDLTGGAGQIPEKFKFTLPSGKEETVTRAELVDSVVEQKFAQIDQQTANNPDANISAKVDFLAKQGGGATYAPWKAALNGVATQALRADVNSQNIPQAVVQGVDLYERLLAKKAYGVIGNHLTDDQSLNMLRLVDAVKRNMRGGGSGIGMTTAEAVSTVVKSAGSRGLAKFTPIYGNTLEVRDSIADAMADFEDAENKDEVEQILSEKAGMYRALAGTDEVTAITRAGKDLLEDMKVIDGRAVFVRGRQIPPNIEQLGSLIKQDFVDKHGKDLGLSETDTSLLIDPVSGLVTVQTKNGITPRNAPAFSLDDLQKLANYMAKIDLAEKRVAGLQDEATGRVKLSEEAATSTVLYRMIFKPDWTTPEDKASIDRIRRDAAAIPDDVSPELRSVMERVPKAKQLTATRNGRTVELR